MNYEHFYLVSVNTGRPSSFTGIDSSSKVLAIFSCVMYTATCMAWWYSEGCLRDSAVLLGPKCSYIVLRFGTGQGLLAMEGHR